MEVPALTTRRVQEPIDTLAAWNRRLRHSDRAAFAAIYQRFHEPLVRYARQITKDEAAAYDVLQDVFMKLWEDRQTLSVKVSLKALLYTMVRNRALNSLRRHKWISRDRPVEQAPHDAVPTGDETLEAEDLRRHLHAWIADLPERRAEAFVLSRFHGLKHSEIADIMDLSERTVDTHILLALRTLRERWDALQKEEV